MFRQRQQVRSVFATRFQSIAKVLTPGCGVGWGGVAKSSRDALRRLALQARRSDPVARCFQAHYSGADGQGGHRAPARHSLKPEALVINLGEDRRRLPAEERHVHNLCRQRIQHLALMRDED